MDELEKLIPKNFVGSIKENYIKAWNIWWGLHKSGGRFLLFTIPILCLELIILALLKHFTGIELER